MDDDAPLVVEGEPGKRFGVHEADCKGQPVHLVGRCDSVAEVLSMTQRLDKRFLIEVGREFLNVPEFKTRFEKS